LQVQNTSFAKYFSEFSSAELPATHPSIVIKAAQPCETSRRTESFAARTSCRATGARTEPAALIIAIRRDEPSHPRMRLDGAACICPQQPAGAPQGIISALRRDMLVDRHAVTRAGSFGPSQHTPCAPKIARQFRNRPLSAAARNRGSAAIDAGLFRGPRR
jgi:hypothetical protein